MLQCLLLYPSDKNATKTQICRRKCEKGPTIDCPQSLIFPWHFRVSYASIELPPSWFVTASASWRECLNYQGGWGGGSNQGTLSRRGKEPPDSRSTLPRLRSPLQTKMTGVGKLKHPFCIGLLKYAFKGAEKDLGTQETFCFKISRSLT